MKPEIVDKFAALVTVAFGLVAALAWNGAILAIFKAIFGTTEGILPMPHLCCHSDHTRCVCDHCYRKSRRKIKERIRSAAIRFCKIFKTQGEGRSSFCLKSSFLNLSYCLKAKRGVRNEVPVFWRLRSDRPSNFLGFPHDSRFSFFLFEDCLRI